MSLSLTLQELFDELGLRLAAGHSFFLLSDQGILLILSFPLEVLLLILKDSSVSVHRDTFLDPSHALSLICLGVYYGHKEYMETGSFWFLNTGHK